MQEDTLFFDGPNGQLCGALHSPAALEGPAFVFCAPLFEERKSAMRAMVETARHLCRAGSAVLRFDYAGCGDSAGAFVDFDMSHWQADTVAAINLLRERAGPAPLVLVGLRAGTAPALRAAVAADSVAGVVLCEPVVNGRDYVAAELRKVLMKETLTFGRARRRREDMLSELEQGDTVDLAGYCFGAALYRGLSEFNACADAARFRGAAHVIHVGARDAVPPELQRLAAAFPAGGQCHTVKLPPFWNLIGYEDCSPLAERIAGLGYAE